MPGVRIVHASRRSCVLTIVDATRPYTAPFECPACFRTHNFKTYHVQVDDQGAAIVSQGVLDRIMRLPFHGFDVESEVSRPPTQTFDLRAGAIVSPHVRGGPPIEPHPTLKEPI